MNTPQTYTGPTSFTGGTTTGVQTGRLASIPDQLLRIESNIDGVHQLISQLEQRLVLVLSPVPPAGQTNGQPRVTLPVPMADTLSGTADRLAGSCQRLAEIISRIEL